MAIVKENVFIGERLFVKTYSDTNRYVVREGIEYEDALDLAELGYEYAEGRIIDPLPVDPDAATPADYKAALERLGVET